MIMSVDTETTGLEEKDRPFCATFSHADGDIYTESPDEARAMIRGASKLIFQNTKFDSRMLSHWGIDVFEKPTYDCTFMGRIIRNDHIAYNLASQAKRIGLEKSTEVDTAIKKGKLYEVRRNFFGEEYKVPQFNRVDRGTLKKYALLDSRLTYQLGMHYLEKADADDLKVMEMESALTPVCYAMERKGLLLNQEYTLAGYYHEKTKLSDLSLAWKSLTGREFVNSAKSLQSVLSFELPLTEKGNPTLTDDVIESAMSACSTEDMSKLTLVREIRECTKRINTYYEPYLNKAGRDHVIHPSMWQAGTRTGRFSYSDPNLQNIPAEEGSDNSYVIRGCFKPRPGMVFVSIDYMAQEYRIMADYAGETEVIRQVMAGADFHQITADMFSVSRKVAKTINFAILYGAGDDKLASMLGVPVPEAHRLRNKYFKALPKVEKLIDDVIATGRGRGFIRNWFGRKMYAQKEFCYALPNHLIQSGGADTMKVAMINLFSMLKGTDISMVLSVHDELVFEMPEGLLHKVREIQDVMESTYSSIHGMRLKTSASISKISLAKRDMEDLHV